MDGASTGTLPARGQEESCVADPPWASTKIFFSLRLDRVNFSDLEHWPCLSFIVDCHFFPDCSVIAAA